MHTDPYMSFGRIVNAISSIFALACLSVSCTQIDDQDSEKGFLSFGSLYVSTDVEGLELTKSSVPAEDIPEADDFKYIITSSDDGLTYYERQGLPVEVVPLPSGTFTIKVEYGANEFNRPYYVASKDVTIQKGSVETVEFSDIPLSNSMLAVTLPEKMDDHMTVSSIMLSLNDGTSVPVEPGGYYYVPSGKEIIASFSGTDSFNEDKQIYISLGELEQQHAYAVTFTLDLPEITFEDQSDGAIAGRLYLTSLASGAGLLSDNFDYMISSDGGANWEEAYVASIEDPRCWLISGLDDKTEYQIKAVYGGMETGPWKFTPSTPAPVTDFTISHDYSDNVLTGSTVTVSGTDVSYTEMLKGLITDRGAKVVNSAGTVVRTLSGAETGEIPATQDWPYLPQGDYTLKPFFKIGAEEVIYSTSSPATSPAPKLTVTAYAETSYSRYTSSDQNLKSKANDAGTGDKVMNIQGKVSISDDILGNPNYSNLIKASLKYDDKELLSSTSVSSNTFEGADQTGQEWRAHPLTASFTFDGVSDNDEVPCHVTGIPYKYDFYNKNLKTIQEAKWTTHNVKYTNKKCTIQYDGSNGYLISPKFYNPSDISISLQYSIQAQYYRAWGSNVGSKSIELRVGVTSSNGNVASSYNRYTCSGTNNTGLSYSTYYNNDPNNIQSLSLPKDSYISFYHNNANVELQIDYLCLYGFELKYL